MDADSKTLAPYVERVKDFADQWNPPLQECAALIDTSPDLMEEVSFIATEGVMPSNPVRYISDIKKPGVLRRAIEQEAERGPSSARTAAEEELTLSYYFGGLMVACVRDAQGLGVVASGPIESGAISEEVERVEAELGIECEIHFPEPWVIIRPAASQPASV
jgi:hypothetical protein